MVIENDHLDTLCEDIKPRTQEEVDALSPEELIGIIREGDVYKRQAIRLSLPPSPWPSVPPPWMCSP